MQVCNVANQRKGIGPWKAIPVALGKAGISKDDVDIWEINEAFASQCLWCADELQIPREKINPKGGVFPEPLLRTITFDCPCKFWIER